MRNMRVIKRNKRLLKVLGGALPPKEKRELIDNPNENLLGYIKLLFEMEQDSKNTSSETILNNKSETL